MGRLITSARTRLDREGVHYANVGSVRRDVDVFVSHKSDDTDFAMSIAACLALHHQLTVWIDVVAMPNLHDDKDVVNRIKAAVSCSFSLLAVVYRKH